MPCPGRRLAFVALVALLLLLCGARAETTFSSPCPNNEQVPCGTGVADGAANGAFYRFQGVESGVPYEEISATDREAALRIEDIWGAGVRAVAYTRHLVDVTFLSGVAVGCQILEEWSMTTQWRPGGQAQCALSGPCTTSDCYDIQPASSQLQQPFFLNVALNNVFYAMATTDSRSTIPFDAVQFRRKQRGRKLNGDQEDNQDSYMVSGDDDRYVGGGTGYSTTLYDDNNGEFATLCDDDNMNDCDRADDDDTLLQKCFDGVSKGRLSMSAVSHPYTTGYSTDNSCGLNGDPGVSDSCDGCSRSLNPAAAGFEEPFSVGELYDVYATDGATYYGCDLMAAGFSGCELGGDLSNAAKRIHGDDDDDTGGSQLTDDDDDDDLDDGTVCQKERGDGVKQTIHGDALVSSMTAVLAGLPPLQRSVYLAISTNDDGGTNGIGKQSAVDADYVVAATCGFCQAHSTNEGRAKARRFFQYDVRPTCSVYELPVSSYQGPDVVWTGSATIAGTTLDFASAYADGGMAYVRSVADDLASSLAFGSVVTVTMGDATMFQAPKGLIGAVSPSVVQCFAETDPAPLDFSVTGDAFPFTTGTDTCNGCTSLQESGKGEDQRLWFYLRTAGYLEQPCDKIGNVGWTNGGVQSGDFFHNTEAFDTNLSTADSFGLCQDAITQEAARICLPSEAVVDGALRASPSRIAAANSAWYSQVEAGAFDNMTPVQMNSAWQAGDPVAVYSAPTGYRPAVAPNFWLQSASAPNAVTKHALCSSVELLTDEEGGLVFEDDGEEAVHFRVAVYIPDTVLARGDDLLHVDQFSVAVAGSTSLCPVLYATPVPSACMAGAPYAVAADATSTCGYALVHASFSAVDPYAPANLAYTVRFNFEECNAAPNSLFEFCSTTDVACQQIIATQLRFALGDVTSVALEAGGAVLLYSTAPQCGAECPISVQQLLGGEWRTIAKQTIPSCAQLGMVCLAMVRHSPPRSCCTEMGHSAPHWGAVL